MEVPSMLRGESLKRLLQGVVVGVALTVVVGFNWFHYGFGWTLGGTAETMASNRVDVALVAAYTPVCVEKFVGPADDAKWEEFAKVESWNRDDFVKKAGLQQYRCHSTQQQCRHLVRRCSHEIAGGTRGEEVSRYSGSRRVKKLKLP